MMRVDAKVNDIIKIGEGASAVSIKIEQKNGQTARLSIVAPKEQRIRLLKAGDAIAALDERAVGLAEA